MGSPMKGTNEEKNYADKGSKIPESTVVNEANTVMLPTAKVAQYYMLSRNHDSSIVDIFAHSDDTIIRKMIPSTGLTSILRKLDRCSSLEVKKDATGPQSNKPDPLSNNDPDDDFVSRVQNKQTDSTMWAEGDIDCKIIPLHAWNMEMLRRRLKAGIRQGGLHIVELVQARSNTHKCADTESDEQIAEVVHQEVECMEPTDPEAPQDEDKPYEEPAVEYDNDYDVEELKKEYMEIIDKNFNMIYTTKWDVEELINEARYMFPDEPCFEHYQESLESLFREYKAQDDAHSSSDDEVKHDEEMERDRETEKSDHQPQVVTPTELDFSDNASLEDIQPLSQIWYSPTTYHLIDQAIVEKSGESSKQRTTSCTNTHASNTPTPSFNLGISPLASDLYKTGHTKGKGQLPNEECPPKPTINVGPSPKECRTPIKKGVR
ncbi:hypothetical protein L6452_14850 [Arctium lappa]|uniref:Uncharacterized protein n=1 Tax=Arctium lappa TaxID=4217 RepID=A0ACB9CM49_ARCLA|nr:hypothetical protein L6452_14850 [Arctium lappa]